MFLLGLKACRFYCFDLEGRIMIKILRKLEGLVTLRLFYALFFLSGGYWLWQTAKFHGVEEWPQVEAKILDHKDQSLPFIRAWYTGDQVGSVDASSVIFAYVVKRQVYESRLATPDGGGLPGRYGDEPWKAFYKPGSPDLAVLSRVPYRGNLLMAVATTCALPVGVHFYFWLVEVIGRFIRRRQRRQSSE